MTSPPSRGYALVTGASGYVGGRLVPELLSAGWSVRALARTASRLRDAPWIDEVDVVVGDVTDAESLGRALDGVDVAYYLVHSIGSGSRFEETDRAAAATFAAAAAAAGVGRIVYLGGLTPEGEELSPHLRSREEVGRILLASGVPTVVLQAAVVLGSGSASFEMLRHLTERLPVMVVPRWVDTRIQPIAIRDVLRYLVGVAELPADVNRTFDIGGSDVMTYADMMHAYASAAELGRRRMLRVPILSPALSSHWVGLVTPVPGGLARPLVESLRNTVVCREHDIAEWVPDPPDGLIGVDEAIRLALVRIRDADVATHWSNASVAGVPSDPMPTDPDWAKGTLYVDERSRLVDAPPDVLWAVIEGIGGASGWYSWSLAWTVRGIIDRMWGGPGLRRGRRSPYDLRIGDAVDFWRVEEIVDGELLRLRAEMKVPGRAWLDLGIERDDADATMFHQRAVFAPRGLWGRAYWYSVLPFHGFVFGGMQRNIAKQAEARAAAGASARWLPSGRSAPPGS
ncbi:MAG: SDR family oxidoreductase [Ilumatobacteraceae bacterium]